MARTREPADPTSVSTFPIPRERDHSAEPGAFVSNHLIFATWQDAGVRAFDISGPYFPVETVALVPTGLTHPVDKPPNRPLAIRYADVFIDAGGLPYVMDCNAGPDIIGYGG